MQSNHELKKRELISVIACTFAIFINLLTLGISYFVSLEQNFQFSLYIQGGGVIGYLFALLALLRGKTLLGNVLLSLIACTQLLLLTLAFGLSSGIQLFLIAIFAWSFLSYLPEEKKFQLMVQVVSGVAFMLCYVYFYQFAGKPWLPDNQILIFMYIDGAFFFLFLGTILHNFQQLTHKYQRELNLEKERSEKLLLNILPAPIATRIMNGESLIADFYENSSVIFADIVNFTPMSSVLDPKDLVKMLNKLFSSFDDITDLYNAEKIKTMGDSYMVVTGVPQSNFAHAEYAVRIALEMNQAMQEWNLTYKINMSLRIGIASGPVVAGVIGKRKFVYDLWGDTVNIASRMESHGHSNQITISQETYVLIKDKFKCAANGEREIKGKGKVKTYVVKATI